jgi:hypothetical protein
VVGNVPFGDYKVFDPKYNKYNFRIHDYFIAKALDQVRPGGIVAVITTKGTLDKSNATNHRKYTQNGRISRSSQTCAEIQPLRRMQGTEVTSDISFPYRRERRKIEAEPDWVHLAIRRIGIAVNSYL